MINLNIIKLSSVINAVIGDVIEYKLIVQNDEGLPLNKVFLFDILNKKLEFVEGSVKINNVEATDESIVSGVDLGTIKPEEKKEVTFKAKAIAAGIVDNKATATFYSSSPGCKEQCGRNTSNSSIVEIFDVSLKVDKSANKKFAVLGDLVEYTITLKNVGDLDANNVFVKDILANNLELKEGTVSIDEKIVNNVDLSKGINIGTIETGEIATLKYITMIKNVPCNGKIINTVLVNYCYELEDGSVGKKEIKLEGKDVSKINAGINNFKQLSVEENLIIPIQKPDVEDVININGEVEILKSHVIETPLGTSNEGKKLTGYKLVVYGRINEIIEYTALDVEQHVHSAHYSIPFSTFVVLPNNYCVGKGIELSGDVEHIYFNKLNRREVFSNATVLIKAILCTC